MKKFLLLCLVLLVVLVGAVAYYAGSIAKTAIERGGTYALGVPTEVNAVLLSPLSGAFALDDLTVANPPGFQAAHFTSLGQGSVEADLGTLLDEVIHIRSIEFSDLAISIERVKGDTNYGQILKSLERFERESQEAEDENPDGSTKKFIVDRVRLANISARLELVPEVGDLARVDVVVPEIVLTDIGTAEGGASIGAIAATLVRALLASSIEAGGGKAPAELLADLEGRLEEHAARLQLQAEGAVRDSLEGVTNKVGDILGEDAERALGGRAEDELDQALEKGKGALDGLLGGKKKD
ncbi:MAG: hypothetical protein WD226_09400 [Planctomycetota bacterium]